MVKKRLEADLKRAIEKLGFTGTDIVLSISPNSSFGDYTTNIALQLAKREHAENKQTALEVANKILNNLGDLSYLEKAEVAGGGFINFFLSDQILLDNLKEAGNISPLEHAPKVLIEYGHANILKEVHLGHLRTFILGESLARIIHSLGSEVFRANYQGDIGLHVAKAVWGMKKMGLPSREMNLEEKAEYLGRAYVLGSSDYEIDPGFKKQIDKINADLYEKNSELQDLYELGRGWSIDYFELIYRLLGIKYDRCFFESEVYEQGRRAVLDNIGAIFERSDGAVIFPGEKYGLHNLVFLNSAGYPTYEAKDMGLAELEYKTFPYDKSIHVVGSEQEGYFRVVFKAMQLLYPYLGGRKYHLSYGMVDLKEGKMSSRTGEIVSVDDLIKVVGEKVREIMKESRLEVNQEVVRQVAIGAIKFAYLKFAPASNIVFDLEKSVSLQGDSGPYLQYTFARTQSVLEKAGVKSREVGKEESLEEEERVLLRRLEYFDEVVRQAGVEYRPNSVAEYLLNLAKDYNLFYQKYRIIQSEKEELRLTVTDAVGRVMQKGLDLLGISAPERM